jgi:hypothetical protein
MFQGNLFPFGFLAIVVAAWVSLCSAKNVSFLKAVENNSRAFNVTEPPQCIEQDDCNTAFFKLDNYCCTGHCCNYIEFVFKQSPDSVFSNFAYTLDHPRVINVIIAVAYTLLGVIGCFVLISLLCCLRRGCRFKLFCVWNK